MTAIDSQELPERLTLQTALDTAGIYGCDPDLRELLDMAVTDHEPRSDELPECPSCRVPMPCDVWTYAEAESNVWLSSELHRALESARATIDRHAAARRLGRNATDLIAVRSDQPVAVPWVGEQR